MAPNFLSKLVKPSSSHSRNSSTNSSPQSPSSSRHPSISISSTSSQKNSVDKHANGNGHGNGALRPPPPRHTLDDDSASDSGPNVTVIPPSPSVSSNSFPLHPSPAQPPSRELAPDDSESIEDARRRVKSLPAVSPTPTASQTPTSARMSDDGLPTPTPASTTFVNMPPAPSISLSHSRSSENLRNDGGSKGSKQGSVRGNHPRSATVAEGTHLQTPKELRHAPSNKSIRSKLSIMLPSRDSPQSSQASSRHDRPPMPAPLPLPPSPPAQSEEHALVESPTNFGSVSPEIPTISSRTLPPSSTTPAFSATLQVPDNSDAVSIRSVGSTASKKRRPWRRGSNPSTPVRSATLSSTPSSGSGKTPSRKNTGAAGGLASALAASGLAMANPGMTIPPISPAPAETTAASARGRSSVDGPRSRGASINYPASDYSDRDSFHSGQEESELLSSDESDDLDLDPEDIPVTGFAVASNKRNQDFHELFPSVPEGDYLIEDYGCALQREILIQGRLYISENHVCFHANIFGWITDLSIPMYEVVSLEKRMTAFVIPNAIQLSTRTAKYTFTSFLSRDTTFDVLYNVWRLARPEESLMGSQIMSARGSLDEDSIADGAPNGAGAKKGQAKNKVTQCDCGKNGQHYPEVAMEAVFPGSPEKIYNLMFTSGFMKDFMRENQKLLDIQISDWTPTEDPKLLARNMTYIKPLNGSIGPKQTRCELRDETISLDFDNYVSMVTTTRTPEVPSGSVFSVKTRTCITWASSLSSKVLVTTQVEWTGRSFIKGIIEKSCLDGQKTYHVDLEKAMRDYIHANRAEFVPEGVDVAEVEQAEAEATPPDAPQTPHRAQSEDEVRKERERERNRRGLQWAYDTFEGAFKVAQQSTEGALELIRDAWDQSSSTTILYFVIVFLVISNVWTLAIMGNREEVGRRKEMQKMEEREKWVQAIVTGLWEERGVGAGALGGALSAGGVPPMPPRAAGGDLREEVGAIVAQLDHIEQRIAGIRESLKQLD